MCDNLRHACAEFAAGRGFGRCAGSSRRSCTWTGPGAPGGTCPRTSRPGGRCTGTSPPGAMMARWPGCTTRCAPRVRAAGRNPEPTAAVLTPSRSAPPTTCPGPPAGGRGPAREWTGRAQSQLAAAGGCGIGAQDVGQHERVAGVALGAAGRMPVTVTRHRERISVPAATFTYRLIRSATLYQPWNKNARHGHDLRPGRAGHGGSDARGRPAQGLVHRGSDRRRPGETAETFCKHY